MNTQILFSQPFSLFTFNRRILSNYQYKISSIEKFGKYELQKFDKIYYLLYITDSDNVFIANIAKKKPKPF